MNTNTIDEIDKYITNHSEKLKTLLWELENLCIKGRDDEHIPIYLTKWRIKKKESAYLKTKRKNINYTNIKDYGGLRLICLFEKDIYKVHEYLLKILNDDKHKYSLQKCKSINGEIDKNEKLHDILKDNGGKELIVGDKDNDYSTTGYKSIHYIIKKEDYFLEVQLRTLVQDVWGELEHSLAYKKGILNPHTKKNFTILSKYLQNIDDSFLHLRNITDRERNGVEFTDRNKVPPKNVFEYEECLKPTKHFTNNNTHDSYEDYWNHIMKPERDNYEEWVQTAIDKYNIFKNELSNETDDIICNIKYWLDMEDAFLKFCKFDYDGALAIYTDIIREHNNRYCLLYRIGEIYFIQGETVKALEHFDKAEILLDNNNTDFYNHFKIKLRLAYTYWSLGTDYIQISKKLITDAEKIYNIHKNNDKFTDRDGQKLANNACWYYLEYYTTHINDINNIDENYGNAEEKFKKLKTYLDQSKCSRNCYDTAAWFHYQAYLKTNDIKELEKAYNFCLELLSGNKKNFTSFNARSTKITMHNIEEITTKFNEVFNS